MSWFLPFGPVIWAAVLAGDAMLALAWTFEMMQRTTFTVVSLFALGVIMLFKQKYKKDSVAPVWRSLLLEL